MLAALAGPPRDEASHRASAANEARAATAEARQPRRPSSVHRVVLITGLHTHTDTRRGRGAKGHRSTGTMPTASAHRRLHRGRTTTTRHARRPLRRLPCRKTLPSATAGSCCAPGKARR